MIFQQVKRLWRVVQTARKYHLDGLFPAKFQSFFCKLMFAFKPENQFSQPENLRLALEDLGPIYVKFGQMLATRGDILPQEFAVELAKLQDCVAAVPANLIVEQVEHSFQKPLAQIFDFFDENPIAAASVAQVHAAKLRINGELKDVAVKVVRPNIEKTIADDLALMASLAWFVSLVLPSAKRLKLKTLVAQYQKTIFAELNLLQEAANGMALRRNFVDSASLYIPEIFADFCHKNVLVMERIYGISINNLAAIKAQNTNVKLLAERGVEVFFSQVFQNGFFHADMHGGNVFVSYQNPQNPQYIGVDFGIVGSISEQDQRYLAQCLLAFFNRDHKALAQIYIDSGWVSASVDLLDFEAVIRRVCEPIFDKPLGQISFGKALLGLFDAAREFELQVQPQLILLQKTLLYVEGLGRKLYPELDLYQTAKPFLERWLADQVSVENLWQQAKSAAPVWLEQVPQIPNLLIDGLHSINALAASQQEQIARLKKSQRQNCGFYWLASVAILFLSTISLKDELGGWGLGLAALVILFGWLKGWYFIKNN